MANEGVRGAIRTIEETVAQMAAYVEELIAKSLQAMTHADQRLADEVIAADRVVDDLRAKVRKEVIRAIERWAPIGVPLRHVLAYQFIAEELERLGDYAVHVARGACANYRAMPLTIVADVAELARVLRQQVRDGVSALAMRDEALARVVCERDQEVDKRYKAIFAALQAHLRAAPDNVEAITQMLFTARDLERIGDRVANVCEDVIYINTGLHEKLN